MREGARDKGKEGRGRKVKGRSEERQKEVSKQLQSILHVLCVMQEKISFLYNTRWYRHLSF